MASIHKRGDAFQVKWRDPDGQQRARTVPSKSAANELRRQVEESFALGRRWSPPDALVAPLLVEAFKAYLSARKRKLKPGTLAGYDDALVMFLQYLHGEKIRAPKITELSRLHLEGYYDWLLGKMSRAKSTARKRVEVVQLAWAWMANAEEYEQIVPKPRVLEMERGGERVTIAPTWAEMDLCIGQCSGWRRQLAILLRCTGLRVHQAMGLLWTDLEGDLLRIRPELGKSDAERLGRVMPIAPVLLAELAAWPRSGAWLIAAHLEREDGWKGERLARSRDMARRWKAAGVRVEAWDEPHHAFRRGFTSGLRGLGADRDAVEYLIGHKLAGMQGPYVDPLLALPLRASVALVPPLPAADCSPTVPRPEHSP